jgi:transposase
VTTDGLAHLSPDNPAERPRERVVHDRPENQKSCSCCGKMRQKIGEAISDTLENVPAKVQVIPTVRPTYARQYCEAEARNPQIALAAAGLLAYVIVSQYSDHLPLHRLEKILKRHPIDIRRSTMCDWAAPSAAALRPL